MKKIFSCSTSQVPVDKWNRYDQKLYEAVQKGDAKKVASLLAKKPIRPTKASTGGQSSFHLAAAKGLSECLNVIVSHKVEINAKTDDGYTALHLAASNCHPECVKLLLQRGAHEDSIDFHSQTPLHCAAASGCVSSVILLCDSEDTIIDAADDDGRTPLMVAAERNHPTVCSLLLDREAQANLTDRDNKTALILACERGNIQAAETLIAKGADPRPKDTRGCDALSYASQSRDESLRKRVQVALDRRKSEEESRQESPSASKVQQQSNSREQELATMWKRRYEEEQKRGLWLQGDLMVKTQELESVLEENQKENIKLRKMVEELNGLVDGQPERQGATGQEFYTSDVCGLLNRVVEHVKRHNEHQQTERRLQEEKMRRLEEQTSTIELQQIKHQEEARHLQEVANIAREKEEGALRRVVELEGHLENMREVLSQFEKRKRIQSTVVEDLQEQITEVINEKDELERLLKILQARECTSEDNNKERLHNDHVSPKPNTVVLKEFLRKLRTECGYLQTKTNSLQAESKTLKRCSGFVPLEVLEKNTGNISNTIAEIERYIASIESTETNLVNNLPERPESGPSLHETKDVHEERHINMNGGLYHQLTPMVETSLTCLQSGLLPEDHKAPTECRTLGASMASSTSQESKEIIDSLKQKVHELQVELLALKESRESILTQMNHTSQEKLNLEEGLLALEERLQGEYALRQDMDAQCKDFKQQILHLNDELMAEQRKLHQLNLRLAAQENEMLTLRDSFPPEVLGEEHEKRVETFKSDLLEELYWNIGTLVMKYTEVLQQKVALQKDKQRLLESQAQSIPLTDHNNILNEATNKLDTQVKETDILKQKLFQAMGSIVELRDQLARQSANSLTREDHEKELVCLEKVVASIEEESRACKLDLEKKYNEVAILKQQLEEKFKEEREIKSREEERLKDYTQIKGTQESQLHALREENRAMAGKLTDFSREAAYSKDQMTSERERSSKLEQRLSELDTEVEALRTKTHNYEEQNLHLSRRCEDHGRETQEKHSKMEELLKELDSMAKEVGILQRKCDDLTAQLEDTNKRHQETISIYRTHLLNAAQGVMDEDVHLTLHWILKMQSDIVY
uniref:Ankyrin repeat domain 35 n=1 Tax=Leptobrachium leishanense TaxID=445787 RepID=A0A8C5PRG5_9ANUR